MVTPTILLSVIQLSISWKFWVALAVSILCFTISAIVSSSENAYFSLSPDHIKELEDSETPRDQLVLKLRGELKKLLATILIVNNFINIAITLLVAYLVACMFNFSDYPVLGFMIETVLITFLLLLLGEITPKLYAVKNPLKTARMFAPILNVMQYALTPFSMLLVNSTRLVEKRAERRHNKSDISLDELSQAIELTDIGSEKDKEMLEGIVTFGDKEVVDVMCSRMDIVAVDVKSNFRQLLKIITDSGYSRLPVYSGSTDNIKGLIFSKDLIQHLDKPASFKWQTLMRQAYFVPESKRLNDLLHEFQENKMHMAIVVDEYGGTAGLITMEDILEEIVGDIADEYDDDEKQYTRLNANTYQFEAQILLNDFYKITEIEPDEFEDVSSEVETLAGLVLEIKGEMPKKDEEIKYRNYTFKIIAVDKRRIKLIRFTINPMERKETEE